MQVTKLKRFKAAQAKTKVRLYKQLVLPIMEYPLIATHALSKFRTNLISEKITKTRNSYPQRFTTKESHRKAKN